MESRKKVFRDAGIEFRTHLRERHTQGLELPRRIKFVEVNLHREELKGYKLNMEADWPNTMVLYLAN
jgi:hypothetical protein